MRKIKYELNFQWQKYKNKKTSLKKTRKRNTCA